MKGRTSGKVLGVTVAHLFYRTIKEVSKEYRRVNKNQPRQILQPADLDLSTRMKELQVRRADRQERLQELESDSIAAHQVRHTIAAIQNQITQTMNHNDLQNGKSGKAVYAQWALVDIASHDTPKDLKQLPYAFYNI